MMALWYSDNAISILIDSIISKSSYKAYLLFRYLIKSLYYGSGVYET